VHVVVSDWVQNKPAHDPVRNGRYFIHASSNPDVSDVWRRDPSSYAEAPLLATDTVGGGDLDTTRWNSKSTMASRLPERSSRAHCAVDDCPA